MTTQDQIFVTRHSLKRDVSKPLILELNHLSFLRPKIWDQLPQELKNIEVLQTLKKLSKTGYQMNAYVVFAKLTFMELALSRSLIEKKHIKKKKKI